jgi:hypothetical protein
MDHPGSQALISLFDRGFDTALQSLFSFGSHIALSVYEYRRRTGHFRLFGLLFVPTYDGHRLRGPQIRFKFIKIDPDLPGESIDPFLAQFSLMFE